MNRLSNEKQLKKKRAIKKQKHFERTLPALAPGCFKLMDVESIPINVVETGTYIHYPASAQDLIGVLRRLPHDVASGLHSITLSLGKEYQEEDSTDFDHDRDPFTGRICSEEKGPFYFPPVLGSYYIDTSKIAIYAYVYNIKDGCNGTV